MKLIARAAIVFLLVWSFFLFSSTVGASGINYDACSAPGASSGSSLCASKANTTNPLLSGGILSKAAQLLVFFAAIISVIMIIIGGIKYATSSGDSNKVASAKNTILFAVVGLVVSVMAQAIIAFVLVKAR